ncbi:hypothetical protein BOX15_Mlig032131g1, partial [Macrostomum lignano]
VLKVEGLSSSEDSDTNNESRKTTGNGRKSKKNKQQKQQQPVPAARSSKPAQQQSKRKLPNMEALAAQQEEWQKKDQELLDSSYKRELAEAIMASRLEQEKPTATASSVNASSLSGVPGSTLTRIEAESRRAANATVRREKLTEKELIRQEVELELQAKFQEALAVKEAENESLRAETDSLKRSLASSEAQVAHLNSLLSLVEGKKAKGLSEQIYQLTSVISELTDSTKVLDSELEKEKTKSRQLQDQLDKLRSSAAR